jgi:RNA polymerase I-specific transcription initiation factor RRN7
MGPHAMRKRALKSQKPKKEEISRADPKRAYYCPRPDMTVNQSLSVYHGDRARYLYFQCCQLMLRRQVAALIKLWDLQPEFEVREDEVFFFFLVSNPESGIDCMQGYLGVASRPIAVPSPTRAALACGRKFGPSVRR